MKGPYHNLVAFVAGSSGELGSTTAAKLLKLGAKVVGFDSITFQEKRKKDKLLKENQKEPPNDPTYPFINRAFKPFSVDDIILKSEEKQQFIFEQGDMLCEDQLKTALSHIDESNKFGLAVNCVGTGHNMMFYRQSSDALIDMEHIDYILNNNVVTSFNFLRCCAQKMIENNKVQDIKPMDEQGVLINTSGVFGKHGNFSHSSLSAAYGAINSMTLPVARDLAHCNIRSVTISPTFFESQLTYTPDINVSKKVSQYIELMNVFPNRLGKPIEYAECVLAIFENKMINGEVIEITAAARPYD